MEMVSGICRWLKVKELRLLSSDYYEKRLIKVDLLKIYTFINIYLKLSVYFSPKKWQDKDN